MISSCDFVDIDTTGSSFTWVTGRGIRSHVERRLDRALCTQSYWTISQISLVILFHDINQIITPCFYLLIRRSLLDLGLSALYLLGVFMMIFFGWSRIVGTLVLSLAIRCLWLLRN